MNPKDIKKIFCLCSECGRKFDPSEQETFDARHINPGTNHDRIVCYQCFEFLWDEQATIRCEKCGEWFDNKLIHSEDLGDESFAPCPICGFDIVEGISRAEMIERQQPDRSAPSYAITICYPDGENVTYLFQTALRASAFCDQFKRDMRDAGANVSSSSVFDSVVTFQQQSKDGHFKYTRMIYSRVYQ